jgi:hypothetical protein
MAKVMNGTGSYSYNCSYSSVCEATSYTRNKRTRHSKHDIVGVLRVDFDILLKASHSERTHGMGRFFGQVNSMDLEERSKYNSNTSNDSLVTGAYCVCTLLFSEMASNPSKRTPIPTNRLPSA